MKDKEKVCGTCKWHKVFSASRYEEWICDNENSEYYALASDYDDECDEWEDRDR